MATPTQSKLVKHIRKGVAIYKTEKSPFWFARIWNPHESKYLVRSTKETSRIEAADAATELAESLTASKFKNTKSKKPVSFETYAERLLEETKQRTKGKTGSYVYRDEHKILYRKDDGLIAYFGNTSITDINAGTIRSFVTTLDQGRSKPLANSTKAKNLAVLKRVLELALDDDVIPKLPRIPTLTQKDNARPTFTLEEYRRFIRVGKQCAWDKDKVRHHTISHHDISMFQLMVHSYLRPTQTELFGIRRGDISYIDVPDADKPKRSIQIRVKGKTGYRTVIATPKAHFVWKSLMMDPFQQRLHEGDKFLLMERYENRTTAVQIAGLIFKHIVKKAELEKDALGQTRTMFDTAIIVTDRLVLDRQLQNTISGFAQTKGVVEKIDGTSRDLKRAIAQGKRIIITTIQKFGTEHLATLSGQSGKNFAVIIDEAHSSQSGKAAQATT